MKLKKVSALIIALGIGFGSISAVSAADLIEADESFAMPDDSSPGLHGVVFTDQDTGQIGSFLLDRRKLSDNSIDPTCKSIQDETCESNELEFQSILPICLASQETNCVEEVGAIKEDGSKVVGRFDRYYPSQAQNQFIGDPSFQLPSGTSGALFSLEGLNHKGGDKYFASFQLFGSVFKFTKKVRVGGFSARITPVQLQSAPGITGSCGTGTDCPDSGWAQNKTSMKWGQQASGFDGIHSCAATSAREGNCAQRFSFPAEVRFYLKVRINSAPAGWLHGRFADPEIEIISQGGETKISVEALPVRVPLVYKSFSWNNLPTPVKDAYEIDTGLFKMGSTGSFSRIDGRLEGLAIDPTKRNMISSPSPSGSTGIEELKTWLPVVDDKATSMPSMWSVRTLRADEIDGADSCFNSTTQLTGLVTTNATQYSAGPPSFDRNEGTLIYKVAAPHFASNGEVFRGRYNLSIRSEIARCVYGFSKAPIRAELSVVSADGMPQIATTIVSEKNGWVYLTAANFEFSAPVIKAKLSQDAPIVEPAPVVTSTPVVKPTAKKITITCVKGKTVKKVSAVKPKCPTGFKKK